jgi:hypothetical protein
MKNSWLKQQLTFRNRTLSGLGFTQVKPGIPCVKGFVNRVLSYRDLTLNP